MPETEADIVPELRPGMWVWFADPTGAGFREVAHLKQWTAQPNTFNYNLAREWVEVHYTDGFVEDRPQYGTHEIWKSGPRPAFGAA
jgi:hypothetical protein